MTVILFPNTKQPAQPPEPPLKDDPHLRAQIRAKAAAIIAIAAKPMTRREAKEIDWLLQAAGCELMCMQVLDNLP
jgi:cell division protein FtsN